MYETFMRNVHKGWILRVFWDVPPILQPWAMRQQFQISWRQRTKTPEHQEEKTATKLKGSLPDPYCLDQLQRSEPLSCLKLSVALRCIYLIHRDLLTMHSLDKTWYEFVDAQCLCERDQY